jgi:hypothetical protein
MFVGPARRQMRLLILAAAAALALGFAAPAGAGPAAARHSAASAPGSSKWHKIHGDSTNGLACPTTKLCVGVDGNKVTWTTNPTAKKPHWHRVALEPSSQPNVEGTVILDAVTCAGAHFCLISDDIGNVFSTTNPTGGKSAWHGSEIDDIEILAVTCSSPSMCAALDYNGLAMTTTDAGAGGPWSHVSLGVAPDNNFYSVSCGGRSICVAVEDSNRIEYTTDPTAGAPTWHTAKAGHHVWDSVSCPSANKCVTVGDYSKHEVAVSTNPSSGSHSWKASKLPSANLASGTYLVDCASKKFCFTAGANAYSTHAAAKKSAWHKLKAPNHNSQTGVSCATTKWCFVATIDGSLAWHR